MSINVASGSYLCQGNVWFGQVELSDDRAIEVQNRNVLPDVPARPKLIKVDTKSLDGISSGQNQILRCLPAAEELSVDKAVLAGDWSGNYSVFGGPSSNQIPVDSTEMETSYTGNSLIAGCSLAAYLGGEQP